MPDSAPDFRQMTFTPNGRFPASCSFQKLLRTARLKHRIAASMSILAFCGLASGAEKNCYPDEVSNAEYASCLEKASRLSEREVSAAFSKALAKAGVAVSDEWRAKKKSSAEAAQRKWIDYRNAECSFEEIQFEEGTGAVAAYWECILRLNAERTKYLRENYR